MIESENIYAENIKNKEIITFEFEGFMMNL
jgi:hypothetical protein